MKKLNYITLTLAFIFALSAYAQNNKQYIRLSVGFYNVENLFDTINQPDVIDEEFTPDGLNKWNTERYNQKLENLAYVISQVGSKGGPEILGLAEVENRGVVEDLINMPRLKDKGYGIAHFDSPDRRGVDVALIYAKNVFHLTESHPHPVILPSGYPTRDVLRASGYIDGELFHFLVAHWSSRSGGEAKSMPNRLASARVMRQVSDSLLAVNKDAKVVLMGDFNDDPVSKSVRDGLKIKGSTRNLKYDDLFTPMLKLYKEGVGTLAYRDVWNLFDILVVNGNLVGKDLETFKIYTDPKTKNSAYVFNKEFLLQRDGPYKNYPFRTIVGGEYQGGYSDHFPVYLYLVKEVNVRN